MGHGPARVVFGLTAACAAAGIVVQLFVSAADPAFFGGSPTNRALNVFAFSTIQSNVLVGVTAALLAVRPDRTAGLFAVARLTGVVAITVTFLVFHAVLGQLLDLQGWASVANLLQHTVVPVLAVGGWLLYGPRGLTSARVARRTVLFPLVYMAFTGVRGPLATDWYPYPFTDVAELSYVQVAVNGALVTALFVALAAGATRVDRRLMRRPEPAEVVAR